MGDQRPIGIFDSGVGGLTVVKTLLTRLPGESFVYFGDTAHVPYGSKTREQLFQYADEIVNFLLEKDVKAIVVACGTHSSVTLPSLQQECEVPVLGVVQPGARAALQVSKNKRIGIIATKATVNSGAYRRYIEEKDSESQVFQVACSRFVPLVESGKLQTDEARQAVSDYVSPLVDKGIDTLVMGCTHYPFLAPLIKELIGPNVTLLDPGIETIEELHYILLKSNLLNDQGGTSREFWVSGDDRSFFNVGNLLLGNIIEKVENIML
ncbi:MAG: glutamate racemase [Bacillota bacterium]|nr:glutamate racemase [Bacillota bacterium]